MCRHKRLRSRKKGFAPSELPLHSPAGGTGASARFGPPAVLFRHVRAGSHHHMALPALRGFPGGRQSPQLLRAHRHQLMALRQRRRPRAGAWMPRHTGRGAPADTPKSGFSPYRPPMARCSRSSSRYSRPGVQSRLAGVKTAFRHTIPAVRSAASRSSNSRSTPQSTSIFPPAATPAFPVFPLCQCGQGQPAVLPGHRQGLSAEPPGNSRHGQNLRQGVKSKQQDLFHSSICLSVQHGALQPLPSHSTASGRKTDASESSRRRKILSPSHMGSASRSAFRIHARSPSSQA